MAIILPITGTSTPGGGSGAPCDPYPAGSCATYIGYKNIFYKQSPISVTSGDANLCLDWRPWTRWEPEDTGGDRSFQVQLSEPEVADYFAFQGHALGGGQIYLEYWDGAAWQEAMFVDSSLIDDRVVYKVFSAIESDLWRVRIANATGQVYLSCVSVGQSLILPSQPVGFTPPFLSRDTKLLTNVSDSGIPLGRSVIRLGSKFEIRAQFVTIQWAKAAWEAFVIHAEQMPFFFWWDVGNANDGVLCWTDGDIPASPWTDRLYLEVRMPVKGLLT